MCENCKQLPFTVQDLKMEFLNDTGYKAESKIGMYVEWLEEKLVNDRNSENRIAEANIDATTELKKRKEATGEIC